MVLESEQVQTDNNASFLRAARAGNLDKVLEHLKGNIDINISNANGLNALHLAAKEGHVHVVTELLKKGANINAATKKGNTALHIASLAGQEEVVKVLANLGANVNVQSQNGFTPLYMAAQENHDVVVSFLLANGANQSLATEDGFTPLAVALQQGHDRVVAVLLENDTKGRVRLPALHIAAKKDDCKAATLLLQNDHNPDVTSKSGFTPLHIAAHYGNDRIATILLDKGADVNYAAKHQITPLHVASKWGKSNMTELLIQKGAKIDAVTRDGLTPLHCAARSGHDQVVDMLLEKGAPILAKTKNGLAPLHMASQGDHVDSARILLYHKAPVDDVTVDYLTALHVAAHCGHVKVAKLLLDRKADANARALNGFTPLHIACKKNRIKVVELLLKHGASIEATTESGLSPLHVASFMGCMNIVIYLIQSGANPDVPTVRGETPLHLAARANQIDIIRILLRNGANVDAKAREEQTPLHIAARLGNVDIVSLLLQHGAAVDATTKDMYTALHIASKEGQEEVASVLLDHEASLVSVTKRGFTPLHLAAKYGNIKVVRLFLQKDGPVDAQGKYGLTPLHVAAHYNHVNEALLLLEKGASPHACAKNGFTPLHIAAKKNQMDIATTLLEYGAKCNSESKAGYTPLHLSSQEGHTDMSTLLIEHQANVNKRANNGLTPLHLSAQEDRVNVASILVKNGAEIGPQTNSGYTPLHIASHFGQINMVRFLLQNNADVHTTTEYGYSALHQAAQQGHTPVVNLLLENRASPNSTTLHGQTALSIAQRLGYISVVETLKVVTETVVTTTTVVTEEKYKVVAPEIMQETFMSDSEDEGGEDTMLGDQSYRYLTADEMKSLGDDSLPIDVTKDEKQHDAIHMTKDSAAPMVEEDKISPQHVTPIDLGFSEKFSPDNIDISRAPVHAGSRLKWKTFLVSFMVDARGGAMRGCRHSGVRIIIPPRKASMPMRITCRYLRKEKLSHPPPLMEGEACASRILEIGPIGARFLGPVIIEIPHFASLRGKEREVTILRSDTGETWREHSLEASEEAVQDVLNESFEGEELSALEDLNTNRITRILTTDFPQYFAIVTRIRQEIHSVGPEGGIVSSKVVSQVQAIFPEGALQKKIRVGLQAQPISPELVTKLLGNRVAVSPVVTVEPRRRKFHKPITLTIPVPQAATKGMINQYSGDAPTLRLLCSITGSTKSGGSSKAQWEDVTGSTPLTFINDCVSFTTTVSARFWLMDCRQVNEVSRFATELYQEAVHVPFMAKFVIFAKRHDNNEAQLRVFCMTDDKEDKTLEIQENFTEIAKSRDVEVLQGKLQHLEFAGNLVPVTNSKEQLKFVFHAFHENRLPFTIRVKDPHVEPLGRVAFMREAKAGRNEPPQTPICNLNIAMPEVTKVENLSSTMELVMLEKKYDFMQESGLSKPESIHRANLRLSDIARELDNDWVALAKELQFNDTDINSIKADFPDSSSEQAVAFLRVWLHKFDSKVSGNDLEKALRKIDREDVINKCMFNVELVTDDVEKAVAKVHLDQSGFDVFKEELGSSREASMRQGASLDISCDEHDNMKEAESAAETSSETGSLFEKDQISQSCPEEKIVSEDDNMKRHSVDLIPEETELKLEPTVPVKTLHPVIPKVTESETWPSGEMDTSQVSVSSLPDDEKSEPSSITVSSTVADVESKKTQSSIDKETIDESSIVTQRSLKTSHELLNMPCEVADAAEDKGIHEDEEALKTNLEIQCDIVGVSPPESPELSFAEKRDFFQKLSQPSSSPTASPTCTVKPSIVSNETSVVLVTNKETTIVNKDISPGERLSFAERLKFFEKTTESLESLSDIPHELRAVKAELWTVIDDKDSIEVQTNVRQIKENIDNKEMEQNFASGCEQIAGQESSVIKQAAGQIENVSLPFYGNKEAYEATTTIMKPENVAMIKTEVEVLVKELIPGKEALEICSVKELTDTNISNQVSEVTSLAEFKAPVKQISKVDSTPDFPNKSSSIDSKTDHSAKSKTDKDDFSKPSEDGNCKKPKEKPFESTAICGNISLKRDAGEKKMDSSQTIDLNLKKTPEHEKKDYPLSPGIDFSFETVQVFSMQQGEVREVSSPTVTPLHSPDISQTTNSETDCDKKFDFSDDKSISLKEEDLSMTTKIPLTSFCESAFKKCKIVPKNGKNDDETDNFRGSSSNSQINMQLSEKDTCNSNKKFCSLISSEEQNSHSVEHCGPININQNIEENSFCFDATQNESHMEAATASVGYLVEGDKPGENENAAIPRRSTSAFKKDNISNIETWVRESPDSIDKIKETAHTSLGKREIFMCTEETLDNVKKILSQADAESNIVLPGSDISLTESTSANKDDSLDDNVNVSTHDSMEKSDSSMSVSIKERSLEINNVEIVPVLEISEEISIASVDKTGHEALGTPCLFNKEVELDHQDRDKNSASPTTDQRVVTFDDRYMIKEENIQDLDETESSVIIEKAEFEDVEKDIKKTVNTSQNTYSVSYKDNKETVKSVEISKLKEIGKEPCSVSSENMAEHVSNTKIKVESFQNKTESKIQQYAPQKLDDFLNQITQSAEMGPSVLPSESIDKRTKEWLNQNQEDGMKEHQVDNGLFFEERPVTYDDEQHKKSSPTAESFDDEARVEKCDTDVMMQLLDYISRSEIELAEVRTEDEAPDIEQDISPSGEEDSKEVFQEDLKACKKENMPKLSATESVDNNLKVENISEHLLQSPLRSSLDSITSPSRKDASEDLETAVEVKKPESYTLKSIQPQSSLEVEVGSHGSDDVALYEIEKDNIPLEDVIEEQQCEIECKEINTSFHKTCSNEVLHEKHRIVDSSKMLTDICGNTCLNPSSSHQVQVYDKIHSKVESDDLPSEGIKKPEECLIEPQEAKDIDKSRIKDISEEFLEISNDCEKSVETCEKSILMSRKPEIDCEDDSKNFSSEIDFLPNYENSVIPATDDEVSVSKELRKSSVEINIEKTSSEVIIEKKDDGCASIKLTEPISTVSYLSDTTSTKNLNKHDQIMGSSGQSSVKDDYSSFYASAELGNDESNMDSYNQYDAKLCNLNVRKPREEDLYLEFKQIEVTANTESTVNEIISRHVDCTSLKTEFSNNALKNQSTFHEGVVPLAFDNTAFVGAEVIDASELSIDFRARSPYEVMRDKNDLNRSLQECGFSTTAVTIPNEISDGYNFSQDHNSMVGHTSFRTTMIMGRKRPILEHIPSEISEEDSSEANLSSSTSRFDDTNHYELSADIIDYTSEANILCNEKEDNLMILNAIDNSTVTSQSNALDTFQSSNEENNLLLKNSSTYPNVSDFNTVIKDSEGIIFAAKSEHSEQNFTNQEFVVSGSSSFDTQNREKSDFSDSKNCYNLSNLCSTSLEMRDDEFVEDLGAVGGHQDDFDIIDSEIKFISDEKTFLMENTLDDGLDAEIRKIVHVDIQSEEDIIERPQTPEPPFESFRFSENIDTFATHHIEKVTLKAKGKPTNEAKFSYITEEGKCFSPKEHIDNQNFNKECESIEESENALEFEVNEMVFECEKSSLRKMGSFNDVSTVHLHLNESPRKFDISSSLPMLPRVDSPIESLDFACGMQFEKDFNDHSEEVMDVDSDHYSDEKEIIYAYGMRFEQEHELEEEEVPSYGDLYTHHEEDEEASEESEKVKESMIVKTDFDILAGRKFFTRNNDLDDISMSSLQEFEKLEEEIHLDRGSSISSIDSLNGKPYPNKSDEHDDISMNSLTEFEKLEKECTEAEKTEFLITQSNSRLSEIEEGHESQTSEASQETLSDISKGEHLNSCEKLNEISSMLKATMEQTIPFLEEKLHSNAPYSASDIKNASLDDNINESISNKEDSIIDNKYIPVVANQSCVSPIFNLGTDVKLQQSEYVFNLTDEQRKIDVLDPTDSKNTEKYDDVDQDSLHEEKSMKPDSLSYDDKLEYHDSLHQDMSGDQDSLQDVKDEMRDSLHEEKLIDDDSLHEMDILPDDSSLSLESSLAAIIDVSHDSLCEKFDLPEGTSDHDFDADSLKGIHSTFETVLSTQGFIVTSVDVNTTELISSTDSLEQTSSSAQAAFQYENESLMSSSLNSGITTEDCTMISSTDTFEPETSVTYNNLTCDIKTLPKNDVFIDSEGNIQSHDFKSTLQMEDDLKTLLKLDGEQNHMFCENTEMKVNNSSILYDKKKSVIKTDDVSSIMMIKSDSAYSQTPKVEIEEIQTLDEHGNPQVVRKIKHIIHNIAASPTDAYQQNNEGTLGFLRKQEVLSNSIIKNSNRKADVVLNNSSYQKMSNDPTSYCIPFLDNDVCTRSDDSMKQSSISERTQYKCSISERTQHIEEIKQTDGDGNIIEIAHQLAMKPAEQMLELVKSDNLEQMRDFLKKTKDNESSFPGSCLMTSLGSQHYSSSGSTGNRSIDSGLPQVSKENILLESSSAASVNVTLDSSVTSETSTKKETVNLGEAQELKDDTLPTVSVEKDSHSSESAFEINKIQ